MRYITGILLAAGIVSAYLFIPEINEWLIRIGLFEDKESYREPIWLYFYMVIFITIALAAIFGTGVFVGITFLGNSWKREVELARKKSKDQYGTTFLYYLFLDKKYYSNFGQDIRSYPKRVVEHYEKINKMTGYADSHNKNQYVLDHYESYRAKLGWPHVTLEQ
ncbi:hypothetical protein PV433_33685 [Paenibacillus sp. GYB004]|uniref:hypothetical protein n=1 Tax=Paenibacillus sp. GYB004 TaxID=2994393 RepID=UPI002F962B6C